MRPSDRPDEPLLPGVVQGFRTWGLSLDPSGTPGLMGSGETRWQQGGEATVASCVPPRGFESTHPQDEPAPVGDCSCGLYASHPWARDPNADFLRVDGMGLEPDEVFGVVEAWGRIEVHADGFRAEFARPIALFARTGAELEWNVPSDRLAASYNCELIPVASVAELATQLQRFASCLDRNLVARLGGPAGLAA